MDDDRARSNFAAKSGMRPATLKDLYFRCLIRWSSKEAEQVKKVAQENSARMAAGGESPLTLGHSCKTLGYRYGHTATRTILGKKQMRGGILVFQIAAKMIQQRNLVLMKAPKLHRNHF